MDAIVYTIGCHFQQYHSINLQVLLSSHEQLNLYFLNDIDENLLISHQYWILVIASYFKRKSHKKKFKQKEKEGYLYTNLL